MNISSSFFTADYRDGRVYFDGKNYPAGIFATHLLNRFYINDTAARIAVYCDSVNFHILDQMRSGYLNIEEYVKTGQNTLEQLRALPCIRPFDGLDMTALKESVTNVFTEQNGERICEYYRMRGRMSELSQAEIATPYLGISKEYFAECERFVSDVRNILSFFNNLGDDLILAHKELKSFVCRLPEAERYDEKHLLPIALEIFGSAPFQATSEYISVQKNKASSGETAARRLYFDRYYGFILTDFFEGLHYGHYPQKCGICGKYFLMQSARKQQYCSNGVAPEEYRGKKISCRKYAAAIHRKERAEGDPIAGLYDKRCAAIRSEKSRGTITEEFAKEAKDIALEHKLRAHNDDAYAKKQYKSDMAREKLYADTDKLMK